MVSTNNQITAITSLKIDQKDGRKDDQKDNHNDDYNDNCNDWNQLFHNCVYQMGQSVQCYRITVCRDVGSIQKVGGTCISGKPHKQKAGNFLAAKGHFA